MVEVEKFAKEPVSYLKSEEGVSKLIDNQGEQACDELNLLSEFDKKMNVEHDCDCDDECHCGEDHDFEDDDIEDDDFEDDDFEDDDFEDLDAGIVFEVEGDSFRVSCPNCNEVFYIEKDNLDQIEDLCCPLCSKPLFEDV